MKLNELVNLGNKKLMFNSLTEWKSAISSVNGTTKVDAYDDNVLSAFNKRGSVMGFFNLNEGYGEVNNK